MNGGGSALSLSAGIAYASFELLEIVVARRPVSFKDLGWALGNIGPIPTAKVLENALGMGWVGHDDDGAAVPTASGEKLLAIGAPAGRLRQAILDYIDIEEPFWLQTANFGRAKLLRFAGPAIGQVFLEAGLTGGCSDDVVEFWDALAARARGQKNDRLLAIGRDGERLTIAREKARTGRTPKWVSLDSNEDGYDVLSTVGREDSRQLSIEVKATTIGITGSFHLTANEWDRAVSFPCHTFHLWDLTRSEPSLAVLSCLDVEPHIPINQGHGNWESVEIPIAAFSERFSSPVVT